MNWPGSPGSVHQSARRDRRWLALASYWPLKKWREQISHGYLAWIWSTVAIHGWNPRHYAECITSDLLVLTVSLCEVRTLTQSLWALESEFQSSKFRHWNEREKNSPSNSFLDHIPKFHLPDQTNGHASRLHRLVDTGTAKLPVETENLAAWVL